MNASQAPAPQADVAQLAHRASRLADEGLWDAAEAAWREVLELEPRHARALFSLGVHALKRGDAGAAISLLRAARTESPADRLVLMTLSAALGHRGDTDGEYEAIQAALILDPYYLPALIAKAGWLERHARASQAAGAWRNCLQIAPPEREWPAALRERLEFARQALDRHVERYTRFLDRRLSGLEADLPEACAGRWREARSIFSGRSAPYQSESNQLHVPRLPAIPFYERSRFDWVPGLEAATPAIRDELLAVMEDAPDAFEPYINYQPGEPVNQWGELNRSLRWSSFHLWRSGQPVRANLDRCPRTESALTAVSMADIGGLCPNVMFSVLAPHTHIPPHHGETNARLVAHLPLVVPPGCRYRVGFERREWRVGEVLVFDDTIEHEAHNEGTAPRIVLIFDVWNPLLEPAERSMVRAMAAAARDYASIDHAVPAANASPIPS